MGNALPENICSELKHHKDFELSTDGYQEVVPQRLLLISDTINKYELLIQAAAPSVIVIPVKYDTWSLLDLANEIVWRAGEPSKQYASVGILDHGDPFELCLLKQVGGGILAYRDIIGDLALEEFLSFLAAYVKNPAETFERNSLEYRVDLLACSLLDGIGTDVADHLLNITGVMWVGTLDEPVTLAKPALVLPNFPGYVHDWYFDKELFEFWSRLRDQLQTSKTVPRPRQGQTPKQQMLQVFCENWPRKLDPTQQ